jgi:hypothetical protein
MDVFISWSGEKGRVVAEALLNTFSFVSPEIKGWMSEHSIKAGERWNKKLGHQLEKSGFGILCLTAENLSAPWLLFEAGSLSKSYSDSRVIPYLVGVNKTDVSLPLSQFQSVEANKEGTFRLIKNINEALEGPQNSENLKHIFNKMVWPELEGLIVSLSEKKALPRKKSTKELIQFGSDRELIQRIAEMTSELSQPIKIPPSLPGFLEYVTKELNQLVQRDSRMVETGWDNAPEGSDNLKSYKENRKMIDIHGEIRSSIEKLIALKEA